MSDNTQCMKLEMHGMIAQLTLTRPDVSNIISLQFAREFLDSVLTLGASKARVVILTGMGRSFCFGGNLNDMAKSGADVGRYLRELTSVLHSAIVLLTELQMPVIAAVNGTAAGAGLGLVLASDLAIAARSAKFTSAYTAVGLTPDAGCTFLLPRVVGHKRALELMLTNRVLDAQKAFEWGLVNDVVDDEKLPDAAQALAEKLAAGSAGAFAAVKRLTLESQSGYPAQLARESREISLRADSAEGREGIAAFLEKRAPRFG